MGWQLAHTLLPGLMLQCHDSLSSFLLKNNLVFTMYSYNQMTHLPCILGSFEPVTPNLFISNTTTTVGSQFHFLLYLKCMLLIFSSLCGSCRPLCAYKMHYKHSKPYIRVHSGNSVHSGKRTHPQKTATNQNRQY